MTRIENARKMRQRVNLGLAGAMLSGAADWDTMLSTAEKWHAGREWAAGEVCELAGAVYLCKQTHTASGKNKPDKAPDLWERKNKGGQAAGQTNEGDSLESPSVASADLRSVMVDP